MTAYVNDEQKKEGAYGKAVKATLAATLAAGMVPAAAAFAEEPAEATAEGNDVELLALSAKDAWQNGVFTFEDNNGNAIELKKDAAGNYKTIELTRNGENLYAVPVSVDPEGDSTDAEDLTDTKLYDVTYQYKQTNGSWAPVKNINGVGLDNNAASEFKVTITGKAGTAYAGATKTFDFKLVEAESDLADATLYQVGEPDDFSDTTFEYTGKAFAYGADKGNIGLLYKGKPVENVSAVKFYGNKGEVTDLTNAGTYTVVATIDGKDVTLNEKLTISKIDLSKAKYEFETAGTFGDRKIVKIDGFEGKDAIAGLFDIECAWPNGMDGDAKGEYKYTVKVKADADKVAAANFEGEGAPVNVNAGTTLASTAFKYGNETLADKTIDLSAGEKFDLSKISVMRDGSNKLDSKFVKVTVLDKDGNVVDASKLNETGVWTVKVAVDAAATEYMYAGEASCEVTVTNGMIATSDVLFALDGKAVSGAASVDYDGTDALDKLAVSVKAGDKELVQGTDFDLKVVKDGEEVSEAVEAGVYTITLSSDKYDFAKDEQLVLTIDSIKASDFRIAPASLLHGDEATTEIAYTGETIAPVVQYAAGEDEDGETIWKDLPAGSYALTLQYAEKDDKGNAGKYDKAKEMKELGFYKVSVKDAVKDDSIAISGKEIGTYEVVEGKVFADVKPGDWYYDYVYAASNEKVGYMKGIGNSDIFAPNQTTTRAMAATVLSRMAVKGGVAGAGYNTPFTDVVYNGNLDDPWYAGTVLWAAETGIVTGYEQADGTAQFRPDANVNRAEFCIMMQRYAAATDQGVALEAGEADEILAKYEDGASVPAWAKGAVAWAVKNEIFGGYTVLDPMGDITRAQMAKMAVAFQAEPLKEGALG